MTNLKIGHLRLVTGGNESLKTGLDEVGQATAQHRLLTEKIGLGLLTEARFNAAGAQTAEGLGIRPREVPGDARGILLDAHQHRDSATIRVLPTHDVTGTLRGNHTDVDALGSFDVAEVDVEAVSEEESVTVLEVRGNVLSIELALVLVGNEHHN